MLNDYIKEICQYLGTDSLIEALGRESQQDRRTP